MDRTQRWDRWHDGWGQLIDHYLYWVCITRLCEHKINAEHIRRSTTPAIHYGAIYHGAIHYLAIYYLVSTLDHMLQEVNYIDRRDATVI